MQCEWGGCSERHSDAEAVYAHVCGAHVGRKSSRNLCLTCGWRGCGQTYAKRDHLTSHLRMHIPMRPHVCPVCARAFKRPQDLKKHDKVHDAFPAAAQSENTAASSVRTVRRRLVAGSASGGASPGSPTSETEPSFASPPPHLLVSGTSPAQTQQKHPTTVAAVSGLISAVNKRKRSQSIAEETEDIFKFLDEVGRMMSPPYLSPPSIFDPTHAPVAALPTSPAMTDHACPLETFPTQDLLSLEAFLNSFACTPGTGSGNSLFFHGAPLDMQMGNQMGLFGFPPVSASSQAPVTLQSFGNFDQQQLVADLAFPSFLPRVVKESVPQQAAPPASSSKRIEGRSSVSIHDLIDSHDDEMEVARELLHLGSRGLSRPGSVTDTEDTAMDVDVKPEAVPVAPQYVATQRAFAVHALRNLVSLEMRRRLQGSLAR